MPTKNPIDMMLLVTTINVLIEKELKRMYNLIGRKYIVRDNSYACELVNGEKKNYRCLLSGETMIVISQPYITKVEGVLKPHEQRMVKVKSLKTGFIYEVLFAESWICD